MCKLTGWAALAVVQALRRRLEGDPAVPEHTEDVLPAYLSAGLLQMTGAQPTRGNLHPEWIPLARCRFLRGEAARLLGRSSARAAWRLRSPSSGSDKCTCSQPLPMLRRVQGAGGGAGRQRQPHGRPDARGAWAELASAVLHTRGLGGGGRQ